MTPRRCPATNKKTGLRCRHAARHAGPHEPGAPDPADLDDDSDAVIAEQERRDDEARREDDA